MAQLIYMRQKIKTVETIKKITHAMRLISMSMHTELRHKQSTINKYHDYLLALFKTMKGLSPTWTHPLFYPHYTKQSKRLIILIGSQKGLCGSFNASLFRLFEQTVLPEAIIDYAVIAIGKKAVDYIKRYTFKEIVALYPQFTANTLSSIVHQVTEIIMFKGHFSEISILSNGLKTFFVQKPQKTILIPFVHTAKSAAIHDFSDFIWEQHPDHILNAVATQLLEATIEKALFESLLAEQAARFIAMDGATRNAKHIIEDTVLEYNKLRQDKITKELAELSGSF